MSNFYPPFKIKGQEKYIQLGDYLSCLDAADVIKVVEIDVSNCKSNDNVDSSRVLVVREGGGIVACNTVLKISKGGYIAFLKSDDIWCECKIEKQLAFMKGKFTVEVD